MQVTLCEFKTSSPCSMFHNDNECLSEVLYCVIHITLQQNTPTLKGGGGFDSSLSASISVKLVANLLGK